MTRRPWPARQGSGQGQRESPLRFLAPARLLLEKTELGARGEARYCRDGRDLSLGLFLSRLYDSFADLLRRRGVVPLPRPLAPVLSPPGGTRLPAWSRFLTSRSRTCIVRS
jgi:hypothetical protein